MFANAFARSLAKRGIHYGWLMVVLTMAYVVCSSAVMSIPGVLLLPISKEFGWSIGELSGPLGLRMALFGMIAPFAGALMLRYGPRAVLAGSAALLITGMLLAMAMTMRWQLWASLGVILGIAPGLTALVLTTTIATRWFTKQRGLVLGLLSAGTDRAIDFSAGGGVANRALWLAHGVISLGHHGGTGCISILSVCT